MIHLDTSVLIDALAGSRRSARRLRGIIEHGERVGLTSVVLYEWLRGPRLREELSAQEALFPREAAVALGFEEAALAAELYRTLGRPRGREIDLVVAACALTHGAALWTLNVRDFRDIPNLTLFAAE